MSLLIVYEGDADVLREALAAEAEGVANEGSEDGGSESEEEDWGEGGGDGLGDGEEKSERKGTTLVRLIDFAHSRAAKGEGRDEGVMKGMETVLRLVEGRLREVESAEGGAGRGGKI